MRKRKKEKRQVAREVAASERTVVRRMHRGGPSGALDVPRSRKELVL